MFEAAVHDLRVVLRLAEGRPEQSSTVILDSRRPHSTPESGRRAGYDGAKRKRGSKGHMAVDTLSRLLDLHLTAANEQERVQGGAIDCPGARGHGRRGRDGLCGPGLHRRPACPSGSGPWHDTRRGETARGQAWVCAADAPLGRRAQFRVGSALSSVGPR